MGKVKNFIPKNLNLVLYLLTIKVHSLYYNCDCQYKIYTRSAIVNKRLRRTQFMRKQELEVL